MSKILIQEIENCSFCPHNTLGVATLSRFCNHESLLNKDTYFNREDENSDFPDWCPLPDNNIEQEMMDTVKLEKFTI